MSTSRITARLLSRARPGAAQDPRGPAGVVAELVAVVPGSLHGEVAEHGLALAPGPLARHAAHADDTPLPAEADGAHGAVHERGEHVHRIVVGFEHGQAVAPPWTLLHKWAVNKLRNRWH